MPRRASPTLTEAEQKLMEVLWQRGEATVSEVVEAVANRPLPAYNTVLTTLRILEKKGYVEHSQEGRAFRYRPVVDRRAARQSAVKNLVARFFEDSPELLVLNLLEQEKIDPGEIERLKALLAKGSK